MITFGWFMAGPKTDADATSPRFFQPATKRRADLVVLVDVDPVAILRRGSLDRRPSLILPRIAGSRWEWAAAVLRNSACWGSRRAWDVGPIAPFPAVTDTASPRAARTIGPTGSPSPLRSGNSEDLAVPETDNTPP